MSPAPGDAPDDADAVARRLRELARRPASAGAGNGVSTELAVSRRVLLDALDALEAHRGALTLVGAHAVYEHTRHQDLGIDATTSDADLSVDPDLLADRPPIRDALLAAGFFEAERGRPGMWTQHVDGADMTVDLLVPEAFAGAGRRGARLRAPHGSKAATRAVGLELALVDRKIVNLGSLEPDDPRLIEVAVAGPTALLCAKAFKLSDRIGDRPARVRPKDAADVWLLMEATNPAEVASRFADLARHDDPRIASVAVKGLELLRHLFVPEGDGYTYARLGLAPLAVDDVDAVLTEWMRQFAP